MIGSATEPYWVHFTYTLWMQNSESTREGQIHKYFFENNVTINLILQEIGWRLPYRLHAHQYWISRNARQPQHFANRRRMWGAPKRTKIGKTSWGDWLRTKQQNSHLYWNQAQMWWLDAIDATGWLSRYGKYKSSNLPRIRTHFSAWRVKTVLISKLRGNCSPVSKEAISKAPYSII